MFVADLASVFTASRFFQLLPAAFWKPRCRKVPVWALAPVHQHRRCVTEDEVNASMQIMTGGDVMEGLLSRCFRGSTNSPSNRPSLVKPPEGSEDPVALSPSPGTSTYLTSDVLCAFPWWSLTLFLIAFESDQILHLPQRCHVSCVTFTCHSGKSEVKIIANGIHSLRFATDVFNWWHLWWIINHNILNHHGVFVLYDATNMGKNLSDTA